MNSEQMADLIDGIGTVLTIALVWVGIGGSLLTYLLFKERTHV